MNVRLRPLVQADSDLLFRWINTRELVVLSAPFHEIGRSAHDRWFAHIRATEDVKIFAIATAHDDRTIGYCQLKKIEPVSRSAELQIRIGDPSMQGRGAGTIAVRELLRYGFDTIKLNRIYLQVFRSNVRAERAYLKCGFKVEEIQRQAVCVDGVLEDIKIMAVLSGEQK